ncbi:hypothetical protein SEA_ESTES_2 [Mycobacterium phage Estes]|uniref:DUF3846 domain-containing protein n=1 Tax=Mycobacterium phage Estes TaxID=2759459 RepID=A0A7G9A272_9CAUD|nr:hypothetical protein J4U03_gp002 [Mycobacterium phage Estes]QNL30711.1 hypothetical protein SEA_ESTES_2 [Mycobacterium phage Estes]
MSRTGYSATVTAPSIRALIIQSGGAYEIRNVDQAPQSFRQLLGGATERVETEHCTLWYNANHKELGLPFNSMASFLWWKLQPEMEGVDALYGSVIVTGLADEAGDSDPISDAMVNYYENMNAIRSEWVIEDQDPEAGQTH